MSWLERIFNRVETKVPWPEVNTVAPTENVHPRLVWELSRKAQLLLNASGLEGKIQVGNSYTTISIKAGWPIKKLAQVVLTFGVHCNYRESDSEDECSYVLIHNRDLRELNLEMPKAEQDFAHNLRNASSQAARMALTKTLLAPAYLPVQPTVHFEKDRIRFSFASGAYESYDLLREIFHQMNLDLQEGHAEDSDDRRSLVLINLGPRSDPQTVQVNRELYNVLLEYAAAAAQLEQDVEYKVLHMLPGEAGCFVSGVKNMQDLRVVQKRLAVELANPGKFNLVTELLNKRIK